jgi:hypothetical protein
MLGSILYCYGDSPHYLCHTAQLVEGAIRTQAFFILQDPYANSYNRKWMPMDSISDHDRLLGEERGPHRRQEFQDHM